MSSAARIDSNRERNPAGSPSTSRTPSSNFARRPWLWIVAVLAVAAVARGMLFAGFSVVLTNDSPDYLLAAEKILRSLDFSSENLRDWRLPGYPTFLAGVQAFVGWSAPGVVLAQKLLGLATAGLASALLMWLRRPVAAVALGVFLGFNPVLLFLEHLVMTEVLFVLLLWAFLATCFYGLERGHPGGEGGSPDGSAASLPGPRRGVLIGTTMGLCVLTRASGLFFCAPLLACWVLANIWSARGSLGQRLWRVRGFVAGVLLGSILLLGPWALRNAILFGELSITANSHRNRIVYLSTHRLIDSGLPVASAYTFEKEDLREAGYEIVSQLGSGAAAEGRARAIVSEQIAARPGAYLREVHRSSLHFLGFPLAKPAPGSEDLRDWIYRFANDRVATEEQNRIVLPFVPRLEDVVNKTEGGQLRVWRKIGVLYLSHGRAALAAVFGVSLVAFVWGGGLRLRTREELLIAAVTLGVLASAASHSMLLADFDRYAVPWDGCQAMVVMLIAERLVCRVRDKYSI